MTQALVLVYFDTAKEAVIHPRRAEFPDCDGCVTARFGQSERVMAYGNGRLSEPESRYTTTEKEELAITYLYEEFRHFLLDRLVTVYTDHRMFCWPLLLQSFNNRLVG